MTTEQPTIPMRAAPAVRRKQIALVTSGYFAGGGVRSVCDFLLAAIERDGRFVVHVIDLATSLADANSVRILAPGSWFRGVCITRSVDGDRTVISVGAVGAELEFQRYRPRTVLDRLLQKYDLVQFVCGIPSWAATAAHVKRPVLLQVATLAEKERRNTWNQNGPVRRLYDAMMFPIVSRCESAGLRRAEVVFAENHWMMEHATRVRGGGRGVIFSPPGVDTDFFYPGVASEPLTVLGVGRLGDARKNWGLLIRAFLGLQPDLLGRCRLRLVGLGKISSALSAEIAASPHRAQVEILSDVPRNRLAELYREATVFALSSDEEGLGVVILEAMASGLPVVATRCGGPEVLVGPGVNGELVPVGDTPGFCARLVELLGDRERCSRMGHQGRTKALADYSIAAAGARFLSEYERLGGIKTYAGNKK